jgi:acyl carrier protein
LFLTGRLKEIINRGGENIAPREVDEAFLTHPSIVQATAFAVPHPTLGEDLAVAVVVEAGSEITEDELRNYAFEQLAGFKVPSRVVFVDAIPKGPTGKLQRIGLHEKLEAELQFQYEAPATDLEALLVGFFAEVLHRDRVGAADNFFALGGDSLLATRVVSRVRSECHVELPVRAVFRKPTPRGLAAEISESMLIGDPGSLEDVLAEIEGMTDEEAERLLRDS